MEIINFITENALILIPVLVIIGAMFKMLPKFPDWGIPWALLILGVVGAGFLLGWNVTSVLQGVLVAGAAVFGSQLVIQTKKAMNGVE